MFKINRTPLVSRTIFSESCNSHNDCAPGNLVCKETVAGGLKTCQAVSTCSITCSIGEFCDAANQCQYGKKHAHIPACYNLYSVVACGQTSDCSAIPGYTSCKQVSTGEHLTCQPTAACQAVCDGGEYCSASHACIAPGNMHIYLLNTSTNYIVTCNSTLDCASLSDTTVCKESLAGGAKTCQVSDSCTKLCSSGHFCSAANICQYGNW